MIKPNSPIFDFSTYDLSASGVSRAEAAELHKLGLLSFDPYAKAELAGYDIEELVFLKKMFFDSGLSQSVAFSMLKKLERPYRYSFDKIYWDFGSQGWREILS